MPLARSHRTALASALIAFVVFSSLAAFHFDVFSTGIRPLKEADAAAPSVAVDPPIYLPSTHETEDGISSDPANDFLELDDSLKAGAKKPDKTEEPEEPGELEGADEPELDEPEKVDEPKGADETDESGKVDEPKEADEPQEPEKTEEPEKPSPPATANLDAFGPEQWIFPAVKPDAAEYAPFGHWPSKLPSDKPIWTEPLGKRLCIIDLESRSFDGPGQLWSESMTWNRSSEVHGPSGGTLNHWAYSRIHGYEYYYVKINTYSDRRDSWKKPSVLAKILQKHDVCVFIDSDAMFNNLELPLEWLMNYWSISPQNNSMALATDPDTEHNRNRFGDLFLNTGFMIMQNNNKTYEIFKDWDACADDGGKHPDCTEFRNRKGWQPTDQGGFGTFIVYDYPKDILALPCTEANGFPESNTGCNGKFIKHVWLGKEDRLVYAVGAVFPGVLLETFHKQFVSLKDTFFTTEDKLMAV